jgi:hypothetical protein
MHVGSTHPCKEVAVVLDGCDARETMMFVLLLGAGIGGVGAGLAPEEEELALDRWDVLLESV